ncbi:hypothetical protein HN803_02885 [candidate division WWE3 bacterium]|jgi:hypothetical protein|nr:hypothetical protein [Candidatus Scalindua sp.]MBT7349717.1 hypothetical protein [candidate division WWE3 bacterium]
MIIKLEDGKELAIERANKKSLKLTLSTRSTSMVTYLDKATNAALIAALKVEAPKE